MKSNLKSIQLISKNIDLFEKLFKLNKKNETNILKINNDALLAKAFRLHQQSRNLNVGLINILIGFIFIASFFIYTGIKYLLLGMISSNFSQSLNIINLLSFTCITIGSKYIFENIDIKEKQQRKKFYFLVACYIYQITYCLLNLEYIYTPFILIEWWINISNFLKVSKAEEEKYISKIVNKIKEGENNGKAKGK